MEPTRVSKGNKRKVDAEKQFQDLTLNATPWEREWGKALTEYNYRGIYWMLCKYFFPSGLIVTDLSLLTKKEKGVKSSR